MKKTIYNKADQKTSAGNAVIKERKIKLNNSVIKRLIAGFSAAAMLAVGAGCGSGNNATTSGTAEVTSEPSGTDDSLEKVLSAKQLILGLDASFPPMGFTDESNNIGYL